MITYVYKLVDEQGIDRYVGITDDPVERKYRHRKQDHLIPHSFIILSKHETRKKAGEEECRLIWELNTHIFQGGWNKTPGGETCNISGVTRKGIGGRKKGCIGPKNVKHTKEQKKRWSKLRKGKVWGPMKLTESMVVEIVSMYKEKVDLPETKIKQRNGRFMSYERALSKKLALQYNVTPEAIERILHGKTMTWKHLL